MEAAAAALTVRSASRCVAAPAPAHGFRQRGAAAVLGRTRRREPCGRLRALPPELSEILNPKLVPGSPSDTGDVSSLIPVSALMLLFYFVSNWVFPELVLKRLQPTPEDDVAASGSASISSTQQEGAAVGDTLKVKKKKSKKSRKVTLKI